MPGITPRQYARIRLTVQRCWSTPGSAARWLGQHPRQELIPHQATDGGRVVEVPRAACAHPRQGHASQQVGAPRPARPRVAAARAAGVVPAPPPGARGRSASPRPARHDLVGLVPQRVAAWRGRRAGDGPRRGRARAGWRRRRAHRSRRRGRRRSRPRRGSPPPRRARRDRRGTTGTPAARPTPACRAMSSTVVDPIPAALDARTGGLDDAPTGRGARRRRRRLSPLTQQLVELGVERLARPGRGGAPGCSSGSSSTSAPPDDHPAQHDRIPDDRDRREDEPLGRVAEVRALGQLGRRDDRDRAGLDVVGRGAAGLGGRRGLGQHQTPPHVLLGEERREILRRGAVEGSRVDDQPLDRDPPRAPPPAPPTRRRRARRTPAAHPPACRRRG